MLFGDLIAPRTCATCRARCAGPLCDGCESTIRWIDGEVCKRCGAPLPQTARHCSECFGRTLAFDSARSAAEYEGSARDALLAFKLLGERRSATALARAMLRVCATPTLIAFVPATRRSMRERGFNQSEALARSIARFTGVRVVNAIARSSETADLASLDRDQRRSALDEAFIARRKIRGSVLLVDDIYTTGATTHACARALKQGGASIVNVVTFARTLRRVPLVVRKTVEERAMRGSP
ncbi:MAG: double zinc ribbon domain-containing protein [Actinomycetota bacterium]